MAFYSFNFNENDALELDSERKIISVFELAWTRDSSGTPDKVVSFSDFLQDHTFQAELKSGLAASDYERLLEIVKTTLR